MIRDSNRTLALKLIGLATLMVGFPALFFWLQTRPAEKNLGNSIKAVVTAFGDKRNPLLDHIGCDVAAQVESLNSPVVAYGMSDQSEAKYLNWEEFIRAYAGVAESKPRVNLILNAQADAEHLAAFSDLLEGQVWRAGAHRVQVIHGEKAPPGLRQPSP